jgi:hypothetical protein
MPAYFHDYVDLVRPTNTRQGRVRPVPKSSVLHLASAVRPIDGLGLQAREQRRFAARSKRPSIAAGQDRHPTGNAIVTVLVLTVKTGCRAGKTLTKTGQPGIMRGIAACQEV